jgi:hypothetical protein
MEFLADNWFSIIIVIVIIFMAVKGNKILGGHVRGGGCCGGTYSPSDHISEKKEHDEISN